MLMTLAPVYELFDRDFYHYSEQDLKTSFRTKKPGTRFNASRYFYQLPYWQKRNLTKAKPNKKKLLLCDADLALKHPSKAEKRARHVLIRQFIDDGFELSIINRKNQLCKIDPKKIDDPIYFNQLLSDYQPFRKNTTDIPKEGSAEACLVAAGENPEQHWNILDHNAIQKILAAASETSKGLPVPRFSYQLTVDTSDPIDAILERNKAIRTEEVETLHLIVKEGKVDISSILGAYPRLKKLILSGNLSNFSLLDKEFFEKIEELEVPYGTLIPTELDLSCCRSLKKLTLSGSNPHHLQKLNLPSDLQVLNLYSCPLLTALPSLSKLTKLEELTLSDVAVEEIQHLPSSLRMLALYKIPLRTLPDLTSCTALQKLTLQSIKNLSEIPCLPDNLEILSLVWCNSLKSLPDLSLTRLKQLILNNIPLNNLSGLPNSLQVLDLQVLQLRTLPDLTSCTALQKLTLQAIENLSHIPSLPDSLEILDLYKLDSLEKLPDLSLSRLKQLKLSHIPLNDLSALPNSLQVLNLEYCDLLDKLSSLPNSLETLFLYECRSGPTLDLGSVLRLQKLYLSSVKGLSSISSLPYGLKELTLLFCQSLSSPDLSGLVMLKQVTVCGLAQSLIISDEVLLSLEGSLEELNYYKLKNFPKNARESKRLKRISIDLGDGYLSKKDLQRLPVDLEALTLEGQFSTIFEPLDLSCFNKLKELTLSVAVSRLDALPANLQKLNIFEKRCLPEKCCDLQKYPYLEVRFPSMSKEALEKWRITSAIEAPKEQKSSQDRKLERGADISSAISALPSDIFSSAMDAKAFSSVLSALSANGENNSRADFSSNLPRSSRLPAIEASREQQSLHDRKPGDIRSDSPRAPVPINNVSSTLAEDTFTDAKTTLKTNYALYRVTDGKLERIDPGQYRQYICDQVVVVDKNNSVKLVPSQCKEYISEDDLFVQIVPGFSEERIRSLDASVCFAEFSIIPGDHWVGLPGLTPTDNITHLCKPEGSQLRYNPQSHQYEILWKKPTSGAHQFKLQYIFHSEEKKLTQKDEKDCLPKIVRQQLDALFLTAPPKHASDKFKNLHKAIFKLITQVDQKEYVKFCQTTLVDFFKNFGNKSLEKIDAKQPKWLRALVQANGACDYRSLLYVVLCQYFYVPVRQILNEVHGFDELYADGHWQQIDLRGHVAAVNDSAIPQPTFQSASEIASSEIKRQSFQSAQSASEINPSETKRYSPLDQFIPHFLPIHDISYQFRDEKCSQETVLNTLMQQHNVLLEVDSLEAGRDIYVALKQLPDSKSSPKPPILYIESPEQIQELWKLFQVDQEGQVREDIPGPLYEFITKGEGVLVFNWSRFNETEMASYMSINDTRRMFKGAPVSPGLKVINLVTPDTVASDRFFSRSKMFVWPSHVAKPTGLAKKLLAENKEGKEGKESKAAALPEDAVDLYADSSSWKEILLGYVNVHGKLFHYEHGALTAALKTKKITLVDPPWHDPEFQSFILQLKLQKTMIINGEEVTVPPDFVIHFASAPKITPKLVLALKEQKEIKAQQSKEDENVYYLNRNNFLDLFRQQIINAEGEPENVMGWLRDSASEKQKHIVLTESLSTGEWRRIDDYLTAHSIDPMSIIWEDLTQLPTETPSPLADMKAVLDVKATHCLIETQDPYFLAQQLLHKEKKADGVCIHISAQTEPDDVIEKVDVEPEEKKGKDPGKGRGLRFSHQILEVAKALKEGKTVILYGELSPALYQGLESVFSEHPTLKLSDSVKGYLVTGKLLVATTPLKFVPLLAQKQKCHMAAPNNLWNAYTEQLAKDYPEAKYPNYPKHLQKIQKFYALAEQVSHGQMGTPPLLRLTYKRLCNLLEALENPSNDNPIKAFFHHDYDHQSETYAYLNVMAKRLFGRLPKKDDKKQSPGVRLYKLARYPNDASNIWRRMNCLDAVAVREILPEEKECRWEQGETYHASLNQWLANKENYRPILRQDDPQEKVFKRLTEYLSKYQIVTLKGEPGTGKTYNALKYAQAPGRKAYFGKKGLAKWLKAQEPDQEHVLIIDEFNLNLPGVLDSLIPTPSKQHKIILTGNGEHYPNRYHHGISQDGPQIYVKAWTRHTLKKHIVAPLLASRFKDDMPEGVKATLEGLLTALQLSAHFLASKGQTTALPEHAPVLNEHITIRDVKQLISRWLHHLPSPLTPSACRQAAYEACLLEWGHRFSIAEQQAAFKAQMQALFHPTTKDLKDFARLQAYQETLSELSKTYLLGTRQKEWLMTICEDMELARDQKSIDPIDGTSLIKSGVLLEGNSGLGKTTLFLALAKELKYTSCTIEELLSSPEGSDFSQRYLQFTLGTDTDQDRRVLRKAFDTGCKLILDEFNLSPSIEDLLNQLSTGKTKKGEPAKVRGFYVLASQNSARHAGNKASSPALTNRLHALHPLLINADLQELAELALPKDISQEIRKTIASEIVADFFKVQARYPKIVNMRHFLQGLQKIAAEPQAIKDLLPEERRHYSAFFKPLSSITPRDPPVQVDPPLITPKDPPVQVGPPLIQG